MRKVKKALMISNLALLLVVLRVSSMAVKGLNVVLKLDERDYPQNSHVVFCPNK